MWHMSHVRQQAGQGERSTATYRTCLRLDERTADKRDDPLPLVLVLAVLEGQLSNLHRAGEICLALNL